MMLVRMLAHLSQNKLIHKILGFVSHSSSNSDFRCHISLVQHAVSELWARHSLGCDEVGLKHCLADLP